MLTEGPLIARPGWHDHLYQPFDERTITSPATIHNRSTFSSENESAARMAGLLLQVSYNACTIHQTNSHVNLSFCLAIIHASDGSTQSIAALAWYAGQMHALCGRRPTADPGLAHGITTERPGPDRG